MALIWSMASCSAWMEPVSEIAIVPVAECRMPTVTSVSVTASPVVLTAAVAGPAPKDGRGSIGMQRQRRHPHQQFAPKWRLQALVCFRLT